MANSWCVKYNIVCASYDLKIFKWSDDNIGMWTVGSRDNKL